MSGNTDLDAMMVDDLDGYGSTLAQMGGEDGYSLFPKSDYQGDGWEPFLPPNPLAGGRFEGIAIAYQTRRRRLEHTRDGALSTLHGNLDHLGRILSNRTLRSLSREGISGDKTEMGAKTPGFVLVDDDDLEFIADIVEPTDEQVSMFLRAETRRFNAKNLMKAEKTKKKEHDEVDEDEEKLEEEDYQRAMKILAKLHEPPCIIAFCFVMTGTGSSVFYSPNTERREWSLKILRRLLAKGICLSSAEITIGKVQDTTSGTLSECCDIEVTICTADVTTAKDIAQKIRMMQTDDLGNALVRVGISVIPKLRRGPRVFAYDRMAYDIMQRGLGAPAADLMQEMGRWEWKESKQRIIRERIAAERAAARERQEAEARIAERRRFEGYMPDAEAPAIPEGATVAQDATPQIILAANTLSRPMSSLVSTRSGTESMISTMSAQQLPAIAPASNLQSQPTKKKFNVSKGDTLEMTKSASFLTELDEPKVPNGFKLQDPHTRPATAMQLRVKDYASLQATHVFDQTRRARSVTHLPHTNDLLGRTSSKIRLSSYALAIKHSEPQHRLTSQNDDPPVDDEKLRDFFAATAKNKRCPQTGFTSEETRQDLSRRKVEHLQHIATRAQEQIARLKGKRECIAGLQQAKQHSILEQSRLNEKKRQKVHDADLSREISPYEARVQQDVEKTPLSQQASNLSKIQGTTKVPLTRLRSSAPEGEIIHHDTRNASAGSVRPASRGHDVPGSLKSDDKSHKDGNQSPTGLHGGVTPWGEVNDSVGSPMKFSAPNDVINSSDDETPASREKPVRPASRPESRGVERPASRGLDVLGFFPSPVREESHHEQDLGEDVSEEDADPEKPDVGQVKDKKKIKRTNSKGKSELKTLKKYSTKKIAKDEEVGEECHHEQDPDEDSKRTNSKGKFELRTLKKFRNKKMAKDVNCSKEFSDTEEAAFTEEAAYIDVQDQDKTSLKKTNGKGSTLMKSSTKKMANTQNVESNSQQRSVGKKQRKSSGKQDGTSTPFLGDSALIAELYEESEILPSETEILLPETPQDTVDDDSMPKSHDLIGHSTPVKSSWLKNVKVKRTNSGKKETQEINVGDPAWHVQQIVKSKHAASPDDHESVLYNIKVEQQEALMGGWKFDISKGNKFVRIDNNGVKHCSICQNKHSVEIWDLAPAILKVMNRRTLPREGRIDCPHCCGIMPQYRKEAFNMNRDRWKQENDDWKAPIFDPLPGNELEIYQIDELIEQPNSADKPSPQDLGITALAVNSSNMSFCVADMQGKVAELDLANGMITGKYHHSTSSKVHCLCPVGDYMYMGLDDGVQEAILDSDPSKTKLQRKFSGQEGAICCLVASPCLRLLFSGSKDCSTWAWDLKTGRVLTYKPSMDALIPSAIQHIANEAGVSQPRFTFAFKHHREPVSCADTFSGGMVTGSWDGTVCVSFLTGYKDRCDDQVLVPLARQHLADFKKSLKDRKAEKAKLNEEVQSAINKKQQKLLQSSIDQLQEQVADLEKQVKALTQIDKVRAPRLKNLEQCRRFFYDSRVHPGRVLSVAHGTIQSGAHVIFAGYSDSAVRQWDIVTMTPMCVYMNFTAASLSSIASDDKYLLTGYSDGTIKLWPIHQDTATASTPSCTFTQRNFATLLGHSDQISCLKTMDNLLVSASMDKSVRVWDMQACLSAVCGKYESGGEGEDGGDEQGELPNSAGSSPPATSFTKRVRLGRTVRLGDSNKSGALQEADFDPIFFSDTSHSSAAVEPFADLLEMSSVVSQLADKLSASSLNGQSFIDSNRRLLHPQKPKTRPADKTT